MEQYKRGNISLSLAAELAGVSIVEFKDFMASKGYTRTLQATKRQIRKADALMSRFGQ